MAWRTLLLIRHAKSDYPHGVDDHDRPLALRGERDARALGRHLSTDGWPDLVLCSTARRARGTWESMEDGEDRPTTVLYEPSLYLATPRAMLGLVRGTEPAVTRLAVVAHNPGAHALANALAGKGNKAARKRLTEKFPTASMAVLAFDGAWDELDEDRAELVEFWAPRSS